MIRVTGATVDADGEAFVRVVAVVTGGTGVRLFPRELQVLRLLAEGLSYAQIAERLCLAQVTVCKTAGRVYVRLGVSSGPAAVHVAYQRGVLTAPCGRCGQGEPRP